MASKITILGSQASHDPKKNVTVSESYKGDPWVQEENNSISMYGANGGSGSHGGVFAELLDASGAVLGSVSSKSYINVAILLKSKDTPTQTVVEGTTTITYDPAVGETGFLRYSLRGAFEPVGSYVRGTRNSQTYSAELSGAGVDVCIIPWKCEAGA